MTDYANHAASEALFNTVNASLSDFDVMIGNRCVIATIKVGGQTFKGDSKCHPNDRFDASIGAGLAMSRALSNAASFIGTLAALAVDEGE